MEVQKEQTLNRLNKIEGQVRGVARMVEQDRYCIDILQQTRAIKSALARVEDAILKNHSASCVESAIKSGSATEQRQKFNELVDLMVKVRM